MGRGAPTYRSAPPSVVLAMGAALPRNYLDEGTVTVFVTVIHRIHDPEGFQAAEAKALEAGLPAHVALPIHPATNDHKLAFASGKTNRSTPFVR